MVNLSEIYNNIRTPLDDIETEPVEKERIKEFDKRLNIDDIGTEPVEKERIKEFDKRLNIDDIEIESAQKEKIKESDKRLNIDDIETESSSKGKISNKKIRLNSIEKEQGQNNDEMRRQQLIENIHLSQRQLSQLREKSQKVEHKKSRGI